jgi:RNA polymerase sigma factor (sigma-70 family)
MTNDGKAAVILRHLRKLVAPESSNQLSDRELLRRFVKDRHEAAFTALVSRHGPMVLSVCQRILHHRQDAEDACQATFLVLARKATSLRWRDSVANWLYEVAYRVALKARSGSRRRAAREGRAEQRLPEDPLTDISLRELQAVLDEELARLPAKYRAPLILCCLEGTARDEAAKHLGWTVQAVKDRLERGRELLRSRLARRGLALSAALAGTTLTQITAQAALPLGLIHSTSKAVALLAAGDAATGAVSDAVAALTETMSKTMFLTKVKLATVFLLGISALAAGAGALAHWRVTSPAAAVSSSKDSNSPAKAPSLAPIDAGKSASKLPVEEKVVSRAVDPGAAGENPAGTDLYGDPLPAGAIARLGTSRLQHDGKVNALAYSPDNKWLASTGADAVIRLWDAETGKAGLELRGHQGAIHCLAFVPTGEGKPAEILVSAGFDKTIRFWDLKTGQELVHVINHPEAPTAVAVSPDGKFLASAGNRESHIFLWKVEDGKEVRRWKAHQGGVTSLAFAADGKNLASAGMAQREWPPAKPDEASDDYAVAVWEIETGLVRHTFARNASVAWAVALSPDGKILAVSSFDKMKGRSVILWDPETGKQLRTLGGRIPFIDPRCLLFS